MESFLQYNYILYIDGRSVWLVYLFITGGAGFWVKPDPFS